MAESATTSVMGEGNAGTAMKLDSASTAETKDRDELASRLVNRFALWSGVAGLIPLPVVDVVAVGGLQVQMLRRLSQIYDVPFSEIGEKL